MSNREVHTYKDGKLVGKRKISTQDGITVVETSSTKEELNAERLAKLKAGYVSFGFALELVMVLLILVTLLRFLNGNPYIPKFQELLQTLSNTPDIGAGITKALTILKIGGDWGILDPIRDFFNTLTGLVSVTGWLVGGILQVVAFLFHFITWIFPVV